MTDAEICKAVANRLRTHGWCQGIMGGDEGPNCLIGACVVLYPEDDGFSEIIALKRALGVGYLTDYNDKVVSSAEEVIAALEAVC